MLILPTIVRFCYYMAVLAVLCVPVAAGRGYDPGGLAASDRRVIRGLASYARARYLIAERSADVDRISAHLRDSLIALPESEIPLRMLLLIRRDNARLLEELAEVVAANPEHVRVNVVYAECLADAGQTDAACRHLQEFIRKTGWRHPEPVVRFLNIKMDAGSWPEAEEFLSVALRKKVLRHQPRLKILQADFILRKAEADNVANAERIRRQAMVLIEPLLAAPETFQDWNLFLSVFPVLARLESWKQMNLILDAAPVDFTRTTFWFRNKLLVLGKLRDVNALQELSRKVFAAEGVTEETVEEIARSFIEMEEFGRATEIYELLHLRNIHSLHYRLQLAWLYLTGNAVGKGLAILAPVKELPFHGLMLKAELLKLRGQSDKVLEIYHQAEQLAHSPGSPTNLDAIFFTSYALVAETAGQTELAIAKFRKAHQLEPDNPNICNALGYTLADHNQDLHFAQELIEKAVEAEPDNVAFLDSLAWVRFRLENHAGALSAMLCTLAELSPDSDPDGVIHQHASEIFAAVNFPDIAKLFRLKAVWESNPARQK